MNQIIILLKKNKNIVPIYIIYILLYIMYIYYSLRVINTNIYYYLTLDKYIMYIFHGFFFLLINFNLINNIIKNELIVRINREKLLQLLMNIGILYSAIFTIIPNCLAILLLNFKGIKEKLKIIFYTTMIMIAYCALLYSVIMLFYLKFQIKSIIISNLINLLPIFSNLFFSSDFFNQYTLVTSNYSNTSSILIALLTLLILNVIITILEFKNFDYII